MVRNHLTAYLSWETILKWKRRRQPDGSVAKTAPYAYGSDQVTLFHHACPGDILWIISAPRFSHYQLPPSLIARLAVTKVIDQESPQASEP